MGEMASSLVYSEISSKVDRILHKRFLVFFAVGNLRHS